MPGVKNPMCSAFPRVGEQTSVIIILLGVFSEITSEILSVVSIIDLPKYWTFLSHFTLLTSLLTN